MIYLLSTIFVISTLGIIYKEKIDEKENTYDEELSSVIESLPENKTVCEDILSELNNNRTQVEYNPYEEAKGSFYKHGADKIVLRKDNNLGDISRIVHIAHECVHSLQKRTFLQMNFIFSNIQILYFIALIVLSFFNISKDIINSLLFIQIIFVIITFFVKIVIESDACYKSLLVAEKYLKNKIPEEQVNKYIDVLSKNLTKTVPLYYYSILLQGLIMVLITQIIYCFK